MIARRQMTCTCTSMYCSTHVHTTHTCSYKKNRRHIITHTSMNDYKNKPPWCGSRSSIIGHSVCGSISGHNSVSDSQWSQHQQHQKHQHQWPQHYWESEKNPMIETHGLCNTHTASFFVLLHGLCNVHHLRLLWSLLWSVAGPCMFLL